MNNNKTILFLTSPPPKISPFSTKEKRPPLGLGSLMALARLEGYCVEFFDCYMESKSIDTASYFSSHTIDFVAVYLNTICLNEGVSLIESIHQARTEGLWAGKIMVGGPHVSIGAETLPSYIDHIVIGEGEVTFIDILKGREQQRIVYGKPVQDLDSLPFQPWDLLDREGYDSTLPWVGTEKVFTLNTSRGCPFHCTFCSVKSVWGKTYRFQSAQRVLNEIEYLVERHGAKGIYFREDHFTLNKKRLIDFCQGLHERGLGIDWACETRIDALDEDVIRHMANAGCKAVYLGIESGSQRILDSIRKGIRSSAIGQVVGWLKDCGIVVYCSFIVATPNETPLDLIKTLRCIKKIKPDAYSLGIYVGIPGSEMYQELLSSGNYEYIDEIGLVYPIGFHIKTKYFYGKSSKIYTKHKFRRIKLYDMFLVALIFKKTLTRSAKKYISPFFIHLSK